MRAYKGFRKDLTCIDYQFVTHRKNITSEANCYKNGFHCAENPLDVFTYYPNTSESRYFIVEAEGDLHEDGSDSKISCTEMTLIKELTPEEVVLEGMKYIIKYPERSENKFETKSKSVYAIGKGVDPIASGGTDKIMGLIKTDPEGIPKMMAIFKIDDNKHKSLKNYTLNDRGEVVPWKKKNSKKREN